MIFPSSYDCGFPSFPPLFTGTGKIPGLGCANIQFLDALASLVTSVKLSYELGKITFSTGKPKLTPGEVSTFQGF